MQRGGSFSRQCREMPDAAPVTSLHTRRPFTPIVEPIGCSEVAYVIAHQLGTGHTRSCLTRIEKQKPNSESRTWGCMCSALALLSWVGLPFYRLMLSADEDRELVAHGPPNTEIG